MISKEEIEKYKKNNLSGLNNKEIVDEAISTLICSMKRKQEGFRRVEKVALVAINILQEYIQQLENKQQTTIDKLVEKIEMLEDVLDLCEADGKISKYKIENLKEEISDFKEILEIIRGET